MEKRYYELVFEGHYKTIYGLLEGFILGKGTDWRYFFSKNAGIKTETLSEIIAEWVTFKTKIHHIIMEEKFYEEFCTSLKKWKEHPMINIKYIKSARLILDASFEFEFKTYARKYGDEIKALINYLPKGLELHNYNPMEKEIETAKGIERYAPEHDYIFEGSGKVSGDLEELIGFKDKIDENPLVETGSILLTLEKRSNLAPPCS
jgi:hypothetical protein